MSVVLQHTPCVVRCCPNENNFITEVVIGNEMNNLAFHSPYQPHSNLCDVMKHLGSFAL
jgi:hypothetical protein